MTGRHGASGGGRTIRSGPRRRLRRRHGRGRVRRRGVRALATACVIVAAGLAGVSPVAAHGGGNAADNVRTELDRVTPALPGIRIRVEAHGGEVTVQNSGARALVVLGYQREPYLRITSDGVWRNEGSLTTFATTETLGTAPSSVAPGSAVRWARVARTGEFSWHDERVAWAGGALPATVHGEPGKRHLVAHWRIPLRAGTTKAAVAGTMWWEPTPTDPTAVLWAVGGGIVLLIVGAGVLAFPVRRRSIA